MNEEDRQDIEINFGGTMDKLKGEYLDMYDGVKSEVLNTTKFDENSDLSMTYLVRINMTRLDKIKAEEKCPISWQTYTVGKLLNGMEYEILLDTGVSKSFMFKSHYLRWKSLHLLPKFASKTQRIQVGNGQYVSVLFIIPIVIDIHSHIFEIFTLVSKIHGNIDLVLWIKNTYELESIINSRELFFSFLNRSIPFFPKQQVILRPRDQWFIKIDSPFIGEISGLAIFKILDKKAQNTMMLKLKLMWNLATQDVNKCSLETVIFDPK